MSEEQREITAKLQVEELQEGWSEAGEAASEMARLLIAARTDLGRVRENNEDKFEFFVPSSPETLSAKGEVLALADGMGGHAAGQIASELALKTFIATYYARAGCSVESGLRAAVREANSLVHGAGAISERNGMGTTLTAAVVRGRELYVAQVGDSRLYFFRNGKLAQVTEDHSWVAEQVKLGALTEEEAEQSPFRNVITRSMGNHPEVEPDIYKRDLEEGDAVLLCSDGLSGVVGASEMERVLSGNGPAESCQALVNLALERGGPDNVTVLLARIDAFLPIEGANEASQVRGLSGAAGEEPVTQPPAAAPQTESEHAGRGRKGFLSRLRGGE